MIPAIAKLAASVLLALILAGCGGAAAIPTPAAPAGTGSPNPVVPTSPNPAGIPAGSIDSCAVFSDDEIQTATGQQVLERTASTLTQVYPSVCDIALDGGQLTVSVKPSGGRQLYECCFEPFIGDGEFASPDEAVTGVGDKALRYGEDEIMVLKGDVLFDISYISVGRRDKLAVVRYLAEILVAKLPCLAAGCPGLTLPPPPSRAPLADVCALLTDEEIEDATGFKALDSEAVVGISGDPGCAWTLDTEPFPSPVELTVMESGGREEFDFWAEAFEPPLEHLPGLGDDAIKTATIPAGSFYAVVGDRLVIVEFSLPLSVDDPYALVMPLVEAALSRLP